MAQKILKRHQTCWRISRVQTTGVLIDAAEYYSAFYEQAGRAKRFILMVGWEFDSAVRLLRGKEANQSDQDVRLLPYLN